MVELSSLDVRHLVAELRATEDAFIDKVYQPQDKEFLFKLRHRERGRLNLRIRLGAWMALAPEPPETPEMPNPMTMSLRKALVGARVRRVRQHAFDRVVIIELERKGEPIEAVVELFGNGNLVLVDEAATIQFASRTETFAHRTIRKGEPFKFPPARPDPESLGIPELNARAKASARDLVRFLAVDVGLGGELAEATLSEAALDKSKRALGLGPGDLEQLLRALQTILRRPPEPVVLADGGAVRFLSTRLPNVLSSAQWKVTRFDSLSAAILSVADQEVSLLPEVKDTALERLERQREHQSTGLRELEEQGAQWESAARRIYERYAEFEKLLARLRLGVEEKGWQGFHKAVAKKDGWPEVRSVDGATHRVHVAWGELTIPLDPNASVETNASQLFERGKIVGDKMEGARVALAHTEAEIAKHRKSVAKKPKAAAVELADRKFWFQSYRWFFTSEGLLVVAGRDAGGNDQLVKKHLKPGDVYFHADVQGAPSCILKTEGRTPGEASIDEAARMAATFSKAFNRFATADAFWVKPEQVSKTPRSGEYVPRGAFVIRGERNFLKDLPLEAGVGTLRLGKDGVPLPKGATVGHRALMGGPWVAVAARCEDAIRVVRGETRRAIVAGRIAERLSVPIDALDAAMPPGNLSMAEAPR